MSTTDAGVGKHLRNLSTLYTLIDALMALKRGHIKSALLLLGAAIASRKVMGAGTAASLLLRLVKRLR